MIEVVVAVCVACLPPRQPPPEHLAPGLVAAIVEAHKPPRCLLCKLPRWVRGPIYRIEFP